jgi:hypothetical protein
MKVTTSTPGAMPGKSRQLLEYSRFSGPKFTPLKISPHHQLHQLPDRPIRPNPCQAQAPGAGGRPDLRSKIMATTAPAPELGPLGLENPMGTDGFEFVE